LGRIPDEIIQQVRDRVDLVDLVGRFVSLKPSGRNHKGLCPFHEEKTPSFVVTPDRQTFKCFGCGEGGNAFGFLMRMENLTFPEALRTLAAQHGIEVPDSGGGESARAAPLHEANALAQERYRAALAEPGSPGARYLARRGIDAEAIERFGIGYAPDRWDFVVEALRVRGIPARIGERAGLLAERRSGGHYDRLRGRVTFPIHDVRGRVIGFGGRALSDEQEPKYLNTPESPIFHKRRAFFGFPQALEPIRREGRAVIVEGYFDLVALQRAGIEGALATCGTALGEDHARELRRRTRNVVVLFDGDEAGQKAMERSLEVLLPADLRVHAAVLPAGDDPDSFLERKGVEAMCALVDQAPAALEVAIRRAVAQGCSTPAQKADAVAALAPLLVRVSSPVERGAYEEQLALAVGAHAEDVRSAVRAQRRGDDPHEAVPIAARVEPAELRKLRQLARSLVEHPHLAPRVRSDPLFERTDQPVVEVIRRLLSAAGEDRSVDLEEISQGLSEAARSLLYALAAEDHPLEETAAERTVEDMNRWLRRREQRAQQRILTERLRNGDSDAFEILRAKQQRDPNPNDPPPKGRTH
jgi:DNA primase